MNESFDSLSAQSQERLQQWLQSCVRKGKISRNTIAVGIVVLHHLRETCPVNPAEVISPGGEIVGSRSRLHDILRLYGIQQPEKFLKEVTTRQAHPDGKRLFEAFRYGELFIDLPDAERERIVRELIGTLIVEVKRWFSRQHLKIRFDRQYSPAKWIRAILEEAKNRSGGVVEQHLVGAKLEKRHSELDIPNFPGHAADMQTGRTGDFIVGDTVYHVTAAPGPDVIRKCRENIRAGLHPVLLVPNDLVTKSLMFAEYEGIVESTSVFAIEDFVACNIIEIAKGSRTQFIEILREMIEIYNRRLEEVETDMSLKIEIE